ncbi:MAG: tetratricopeptide repeat protein [Candidatus Latescibacterota bacterium]|nr:MAG: tetratricopeptide repeat protein [Candidatus Latescibacterota bacterium]
MALRFTASLPLLFALIASIGCGDRSAPEHAPDVRLSSATFVGRAACSECHPGPARLLEGSDHDLAMQPADATTVLGDFDDVEFHYAGVTSRFFRRGDRYFVRTDGPDGEMRDYRIAYAFGVRPLQQYLVEMPDGRYQALGICWDTRAAVEGGQRWFHLYPEADVDHDDPLHWTAPSQNWNHMCAECHSTNLQKNFDSQRNRFETSWSEIDVSCEACHGPASNHVASARQAGGRPRALPVALSELRAGAWEFQTGKPTARRIGWNDRSSARPRLQIETCARCHSRRTWITAAFEPGRPLEDSHRVSLLEADLYHPDGQILDEVYVYGSFLQSRMYAAGVTCTDCHDPHSMQLVAEGNALCSRCHAPTRFDTTEHHRHPIGSPGSRCVECHMRARTYMVVDRRRDHSFRVPRPDLSVKIAPPNACNECHRERSTEWAEATVREWYGSERAGTPHYGEALAAARSGRAGADTLLLQAFATLANPGIARATALNELLRYAGARTAASVARGARDADPLVRRTAAEMLGRLPVNFRLRVGVPLLGDSIRTVRLAAATALAATPQASLSPDQSELLERAISELRKALQRNADRADALVNLGNLEMRLGRVAEAEATYRQSMRRDRFYLPAYVNLADLLRRQQRDEEGERLLLEALAVAPGNPEVHHALGLLLVRTRRIESALENLCRAAERRPSNPRFALVYAIALFDSGEKEQALFVLEQAQARHPSDPDLLAALARFR